jgi:hypothetical protein
MKGGRIPLPSPESRDQLQIPFGVARYSSFPRLQVQYRAQPIGNHRAPRRLSSLWHDGFSAQGSANLLMGEQSGMTPPKLARFANRDESIRAPERTVQRDWKA